MAKVSIHNMMGDLPNRLPEWLRRAMTSPARLKSVVEVKEDADLGRLIAATFSIPTGVTVVVMGGGFLHELRSIRDVGPGLKLGYIHINFRFEPLDEAQKTGKLYLSTGVPMMTEDRTDLFIRAEGKIAA